jgi:D-alanine-D-alanine ligase
VFDRPERVEERPGLARTYFAQRCVSDAQLEQMIAAFRSIGAYVELFHGEQPLLRALADGRLQRMSRPIKLIYNGIEGGIGDDGFEPGRKALIPAVSDSYGVLCANSNAYGCALGRHKFHYFTVLRALGVRAPRAWHYRPSAGWAGGLSPEDGLKVIVKSTFESWSVGVTDGSVFVVDDACEDHVSTIAREIGQSVTVQEFVPGPEICVPIFACPDRVVTPPIEAVLTKAPGDPGAVTTVDDNLQDEGIIRRRYTHPPDVVQRLRESTAAAFDVLELGAFARMDFRVDADGDGWLTDVGVSPGLGQGNSAFSSLAELGFDYASFIRIVVAATLGSRGLLPNSHARIQSPAA